MSNFREITSSEEYEKQREALQKSINSKRVAIDFSTFKQTKEDRELAATFKAQWREAIRKEGHNKRSYPHKTLFKG